MSRRPGAAGRTVVALLTAAAFRCLVAIGIGAVGIAAAPPARSAGLAGLPASTAISSGPISSGPISSGAPLTRGSATPARGRDPLTTTLLLVLGGGLLLGVGGAIGLFLTRDARRGLHRR